MKKFVAVLCAAAMLITTLTACAAPAAGGAQAAAPAQAGATTHLIMATGGTSGTYYPYGGAVATVFQDKVPGASVNVQSTGASAENIRLIAAGDADIAIVQNDVMNYAFNGTETFEGKKEDNFAAMATLYAEVCQIIVDADAGITSVADLKGKRVSVGDVGSGVEANAKQILGAFGITFDDIQAEHLGFGPSADAMKDKKIDAFFVTAGAPTTAVLELATTNAISVLPIEGAELDGLMSEYGFYTKYTIPAGTYKGVDADVNTLAIKATFIVRKELDEALVYDLTKALFENIDTIAAAHAKGAELNVNDAVQGISVPFHPGAEKYFKEVGAIK